MCSCRKNRPAKPKPNSQGKMASQEFVLIARDGKKQTFGSKLEATAANARMGYTGKVKPA